MQLGSRGCLRVEAGGSSRRAGPAEVHIRQKLDGIVGNDGMS